MEATLKYAEHKLDEAIRQGDPDETIAYWRGYRDCAKVLQQTCNKVATGCKPLTLDQLRNMYGEPARFVDLYTEYEENVIVGVSVERGVFYSALDETDLYKDTRDYGARWVAYGFKAMKGE